MHAMIQRLLVAALLSSLTVACTTAAPKATTTPPVLAQRHDVLSAGTRVVNPSAGAPARTSPALLDGFRVAGNRSIIPDDETKVAIALAGLDKVIGSFKLCVSTEGVVQYVRVLRTTGFAAYDEKILREMNAWAYSPYRVNGVAVPVCTAVTFIYRQSNPPPRQAARVGE